MLVLLRGFGRHVVRRLTMTTNATTAEDVGDEDSLASAATGVGSGAGVAHFESAPEEPCLAVVRRE